MNIFKIVLLFGAWFLGGCSHTSHVALLSDGNLDGKNLQNIVAGQVLKGKDCWFQHNLSDAFRDAIKKTQYDTLVDVNVTTKTNLFVWWNCVQIEGKGVKSSDLKQLGEMQ
jgi:hypothetical protein